MPITIGGLGSGGVPVSGFTPSSDVWTFGVADAPSFTFTVTGDQTALYTPGLRVQLTQTTVKYFIVTAASFGAGVTTVTVYGGTDYSLVDAAITANSISRDKDPAGFPLDLEKWTQTFTDTADRQQLTPVQNTWYNIGTLKLNIPIGSWLVEYAALADANGGLGTADIQTSLSTANNSESDTSMSARTLQQVGAAGIRFMNPHSRRRFLTLAAKTDYFLVFKSNATSQASIDLRGDVTPTVIKASSAYL